MGECCDLEEGIKDIIQIKGTKKCHPEGRCAALRAEASKLPWLYKVQEAKMKSKLEIELFY